MPPPPFTISQILRWATSHRKRTGEWPTAFSGPLLDGPAGDNWRRVDNALRYGLRGLDGGSSVVLLISTHFGVRSKGHLQQLTVKQIVSWADKHHAATGRWPMADSGPIGAAAGEVWQSIDQVLRAGGRGLPGGSSLAKVLHEAGRVKNRLLVPRLSKAKILRWVKAHRRRTGEWPTVSSGSIEESPGDTWDKIDSALRQGARGLRRKASLTRLLLTDAPAPWAVALTAPIRKRD